MNAEQFSRSVVEIMALPSPQRHQQLADLHGRAFTAYVAALNAIADEKAAEPVNVGEDTRTLAQVIGHIFAWDRFAIQGAGDLLAGIEQPRMIASTFGWNLWITALQHYLVEHAVELPLDVTT